MQNNMQKNNNMPGKSSLRPNAQPFLPIPYTQTSISSPSGSSFRFSNQVIGNQAIGNLSNMQNIPMHNNITTQSDIQYQVRMEQSFPVNNLHRDSQNYNMNYMNSHNSVVPSIRPPKRVIFLFSESKEEIETIAKLILSRGKNFEHIKADKLSHRYLPCGLYDELSNCEKMPNPPEGYIISGFLKFHIREIHYVLDALKKNNLFLTHVICNNISFKEVVEEFNRNNQDRDNDDVKMLRQELMEQHSLSYEACYKYFYGFKDFFLLDISHDKILDIVFSDNYKQFKEKLPLNQDDGNGPLLQLTDFEKYGKILDALGKTYEYYKDATIIVNPCSLMDYSSFSRRFYDFSDYQICFDGIGIRCLFVKFENEFFIIMPNRSVIFEISSEYVPKAIKEMKSPENKQIVTFVFSAVMLSNFLEDKQFGIFLYDIFSYHGRQIQKWSQRQKLLQKLLKEQNSIFKLGEFFPVEKIKKIFEKAESQGMKELHTGLCFVPPGWCHVGWDKEMYLYPLLDNGIDARLWNSVENTVENNFEFDLFLVDENGYEGKEIGKITIDNETINRDVINDGNIVRIKRDKVDGKWKYISRKPWSVSPTSCKFYSDNANYPWCKENIVRACAALKDFKIL